MGYWAPSRFHILGSRQKATRLTTPNDNKDRSPTPTDLSSLTFLNESEKHREFQRQSEKNGQIVDLKQDFENKCNNAK
jgi:hypothetical protein